MGLGRSALLVYWGLNMRKKLRTSHRFLKDALQERTPYLPFFRDSSFWKNPKDEIDSLTLHSRVRQGARFFHLILHCIYVPPRLEESPAIFLSEKELIIYEEKYLQEINLLSRGLYDLGEMEGSDVFRGFFFSWGFKVQVISGSRHKFLPRQWAWKRREYDRIHMDFRNRRIRVRGGCLGE